MTTYHVFMEIFEMLKWDGRNVAVHKKPISEGDIKPYIQEEYLDSMILLLYKLRSSWISFLCAQKTSSPHSHKLRNDKTIRLMSKIR